MKLIDLTHPVSTGMPFFPGTQAPLVEDIATIEKDFYNEKKMLLSSHTGTHVDAPGHMIAGGPTLDQLPLERFTGNASVIDLTAVATGAIEAAELKKHEDLIGNSEFILLHSGWSQYWEQVRYFSGFPVLTEEAASWLAGFPLKGVGMDMASVDTVAPPSIAIHTILLGAGFLIIENLTNLEMLPQTGFTFSCFPLKVVYADGSPIRAIASFLK